MTIIPESISTATRPLAVQLPKYAQLMNIPEPAFFGVNWTGNVNYHAPTIWTADQRQAISQALEKVQLNFEEKIGYPLVPKYYEGERHKYTSKVIRTDHAFTIEFGKKTVSTISSGLTITTTSDPAAASCATSVTDVGEIKLYHPGTDIEIFPSSLLISIGTLFIEVPLARLVKVDNNPAVGWDYTDLSNFESTIDVKREYLDTTDPGSLVRLNTCDNCDETVDIADCVYQYDKDFGLIHIKPTRTKCYSYVFADLNYKAGLESIDARTEKALVRYAHSMLDIEPVDDLYVKSMWNADRGTIKSPTSDQLSCPWGQSEGAWEAWVIAKEMVVHRAGSI